MMTGPNTAPIGEKLLRLKTYLEIAILAGGIVMMGTACDNDDDKNDTASISTIGPGHTTSTLDKKSLKEAAQLRSDAIRYVKGDGRNNVIADSVQNFGTKIVRAAEDGGTGSYRFTTVTGKSGRGVGNEGWGFLVYQPYKSEPPFTFSVAVYQEYDGTFALNKGVKGIAIGPEEAGDDVIQFMAPDYDDIYLSKIDDDHSWQTVRISNNPGQTSNNELVVNEAAAKLRSHIDLWTIDNEALLDAAMIMEMID